MALTSKTIRVRHSLDARCYALLIYRTNSSDCEDCAR